MTDKYRIPKEERKIIQNYQYLTGKANKYKIPTTSVLALIYEALTDDAKMRVLATMEELIPGLRKTTSAAGVSFGLKNEEKQKLAKMKLDAEKALLAKRNVRT